MPNGTNLYILPTHRIAIYIFVHQFVHLYNCRNEPCKYTYDKTSYILGYLVRKTPSNKATIELKRTTKQSCIIEHTNSHEQRHVYITIAIILPLLLPCTIHIFNLLHSKIPILYNHNLAQFHKLNVSIS